MIFECLYHQFIPRGSNVLYILFAHPSCLLVEKWQPRQIYLVSLVTLLIEKKKSQTNITSFFKKADQNHKKNDDVIYVGGMYFLLTIHSFCNDYYFCLI